MRVLLKQQQSNLFFKRNGQWGADETDANDFKTPLDAINFCELHHLSDTAIIVSEGDQKYEMPLRCDE